METSQCGIVPSWLPSIMSVATAQNKFQTDSHKGLNNITLAMQTLPTTANRQTQRLLSDQEPFHISELLKREGRGYETLLS